MTEPATASKLPHDLHVPAAAWDYAAEMASADSADVETFGAGPIGAGMGADPQPPADPTALIRTPPAPRSHAAPAAPNPALPNQVNPAPITTTSPPRATPDAVAAAATFGAATLGIVLETDPAPGSTTSTISNAGATAMSVPQAVATYGVTGAGLTIGILSDSFAGSSDGAAQAAQQEADGDLPGTVDVLSDYSGGSDEGRAMAELVHAVAPGATIDFATAYDTEQAFATNILALAAAGCKIIVDDVTYYQEPFFQIGSVLQNAIETVIGEGVSYFTAASNEGTNFYEAGISLVSGLLPGFRDPLQLQNFGTAEQATSGSATLQQITLSTSTSFTIDLQWTQPFFSIDGTGSAYSLSLYLYQDGKLVQAAADNVTGNDPVQLLQFTSTGSSDPYELAIALNGGTLVSGGTLKYIIYSGNPEDATIHDAAAHTGSGTVIGHELLPDVNTVGAVAAGSSSVESFSSVGPGEVYYNAGGTLLATPTAEGKVDFLASDGIETSVTGGYFQPFYGTSAAAPDAAAVAALVLQANPNLTTAQVSATLASTATAIGGAATLTGTGLVDADAAVGQAYGDGWTVAAGGSYATASGWSTGAVPSSAIPVTLDDDLGTLSAAYTVTVTTAGATAETLTVGNDTDVAATLSIPTGGALTVAGGAYAGTDGRILDAGTLAVGGDLGGAGTLDLLTGGLLRPSGTPAAVLASGLTGTIAVSGLSFIDLSGLAYNALYAENYSGSTGTLTISLGGTTEAVLHLATTSSYSFAYLPDLNLGEEIAVACFRCGTRIATPIGEIPVERLRVGDPVLTVAGAAAPVRWIGRRAYPAEAAASSRKIQPIRIAAGTLGHLRPLRDLDVSPEHALLLPDLAGDVLIPAGHLIDGAGIRRIADPGDVEYLHVMLDRHDAILANGVACETFIDDENSIATFDNAASHRGPPAAPGPVAFCAPRITDGTALLRVRRAIAGPTPGRLDGCIDGADHEDVVGWAHDPTHPTAPVMLEVLVDGIVTGAVLADSHRDDLASAGIGDGHCGFRFHHQPGLDGNRRHVISVRRATDSADLDGSPRLIDHPDTTANRPTTAEDEPSPPPTSPPCSAANWTNCASG